MKEITMGFDPEFLLCDMTQGGAPSVACGKFGGTKEKGREVASSGSLKGFSYHEDNVALELTTPVAKSPREAYQIICSALDAAEQLSFSQGLELWPKDSATFPAESLQSRKAQEFGCDPDFSAYQGGAQREQPPNFGNTRYAGGHIHIGGTFNCPTFVVPMFLDLALIRELITSRIHDNRSESPRSRWYGQPGVFRPKDYGLEYRTPGSSWVQGIVDAREVVYAAWDTALWLASDPAKEIKKVFDTTDWTRVQTLITSSTHLPKHGLIKEISPRFVEKGIGD